MSEKKMLFPSMQYCIRRSLSVVMYLIDFFTVNQVFPVKLGRFPWLFIDAVIYHKVNTHKAIFCRGKYTHLSHWRSGFDSPTRK